MSDINSNYQNVVINLRSDDDEVQGIVANDTELSYQFNRNLDIPLNYNLQVSVLSAEIPHSWYTWDEPIRMGLIWDDTGGNSTFALVQFPAQNWSPCLFRGAFLAWRKTLPLAQQNIDMTFNMNTLKWTFGGTGTGNWAISITAASGGALSKTSAASVWRCFGFTPPAQTLPTFYKPAWDYNTPVSTSVCDFTRFHTLSVTSKLLNTSSIDSNSPQVGDQHVLTKIPVNAPFGSIILYKGNLLDGYLYRTKRFNRVDLAIRDHDGSLVQLNGGRFNITLLCQYIKRTQDIINSMPELPPAILTANQIHRNADVRVTRDEDEIRDRNKALKFLRDRGLGRLAA